MLTKHNAISRWETNCSSVPSINERSIAIGEAPSLAEAPPTGPADTLQAIALNHALRMIDTARHRCRDHRGPTHTSSGSSNLIEEKTTLERAFRAAPRLRSYVLQGLISLAESAQASTESAASRQELPSGF
jgi:hypothetical protein